MSANETNYELLQIREALANLPSLLSSAISTTSGAFQVYMAAGWSPVLGLADDGTYYYIQVKDWVGGTGTKPLVGQYLSTAGWTNNIASASRIAIVGGGIPDGDKGDIVVSSGGTVWTIEARAITAAKLFEVASARLLGRHAGSAGDVQEVGLDSTLEFQGGNVRRAALTGDVTASAGSNSTTIAPAADPSWITSLALNKLTQSGATTGQIAQWNGTAWVPVTFSGGIGGSTGATDNSILRADGTGGSTVQSSAVAIDDSGNVAHTNWSISTATYSGRNYARIASLATNASLILTPSGNGYLALTVPDGLFTGGNNRGNFAVDLTIDRQLASQVASGLCSFAAGRRATASTDTAIAMGDSPTASGASAVAIGYFPIATGSYSVALGSCTSSAAFSTSFGYYSLAHLYGMVASASGRFAATGDAQISTIIARNSTAANSTPVSLFLDGSSSRIVIPANTLWAVDLTFVGRTNTAGAAYAVFRRQCIVWRGVAANTTVCSTPVTIGVDQGSNAGLPPAGWAVSVVADTTNGGPDLQVTGSAAAGIARWDCRIQLTELTFP